MNPTRQTSSLQPLFAALALALASVATGCTVSVEADVPDIQITQHGVMFQGSPATGGAVSMTKSYSQQHSKLDLPAGIDSQVTTLAVTLTADSGVADLSFIQFLSVSMSADGDGAPIVLGSYEPAAGATVGSSISLTTLNPVNVLDAWKTDSATFTLQIAGALPTNDWSGDVTVDLSGTAKYKY